MVMQLMRSGASNRFIKIILFGLLLMATMGLVMMDVGGFFRSGGISSSDVAKVGNQSISLSTFDRSLRRTLSRIGIGPTEAYKMGYVDQLLAGEMRSRMLDQIATAHDVTISRKHVAGEVKRIVEPMAQGRDAKEVLKQVLNAQGITEFEFTDSIRRDMAASLLTTSVASGFTSLSDDLAHDLYLGQNEMRDIEYVVFPDKDVKDVPEPTDEQLLELYNKTKEKYAILETRVLQIIKVKDDNLKKTLEITDEELQAAYESNIDSYTTPASHRVEQVVVPSEETARKIYESAKSGKSMKDAAKDAGQLSSYLGSQDAEDRNIPPEFKDKVLAAKEGELIEPVKSPIGFHVVKVIKALPENVKPFETVKKDIKDEMYESKLIDQKYALSNEVDDMLAGGATPDEVTKQADVEISTLPAINSFGQTPDKQDALKAYEKTGSAILENGFELGEGETSPVSEMPDASFMAVHVKSITPKSYTPFEKVRTEIANNWKQDQAAASNRTKIAMHIKEIADGKKTLQEVASEAGHTVKTVKGLTRKSEVPKPLNTTTLETLFTSNTGRPAFIGTEEGFGIGMVTQVRWPEKVNVSDDEFKKFKADLAKDTQNEAMMAYLENKSRKYKPVVNNELLRRAYTPQDDGSQ